MSLFCSTQYSASAPTLRTWIQSGSQDAKIHWSSPLTSPTKTPVSSSFWSLDQSPSKSPIKTPLSSSSWSKLLDQTLSKSTNVAETPARDRSTDKLTPEGDESVPLKYDKAEKSTVLPTEYLLGDRESKCRTFQLPNRGEKLFMLANECAQILGYKDLHSFFTANRSIDRTFSTGAETSDLIHRGILTPKESAQRIPIVHVTSIPQEFGSKIIIGELEDRGHSQTHAYRQGSMRKDLTEVKSPDRHIPTKNTTEVKEIFTSTQVLRNKPHKTHVDKTRPFLTLGSCSSRNSATSLEFGQTQGSGFYEGTIEVKSRVSDLTGETPSMGSIPTALNSNDALLMEASQLAASQSFLETMSDAPFEITYSLQNGFRDTLTRRKMEVSDPAKGTLFDGIVAIIGTPLQAEVIDVQAYVLKEWPDFGPSLLAAIMTELGVNTPYRGLQNPEVQIRSQILNRHPPNIIVKGNKKAQEQIRDTLAWISATTIPPQSMAGNNVKGQNQIYLRQANVRQIPGEQTVCITTLQSTSFEHSCWQDLFIDASIIQGFPPPTWSEGTQGLRMTFSEMVNIAAVERCTYFHRVPVLYSSSTLLVPVKQTANGTTVQWHIEVDLNRQVELSLIDLERYAEMQDKSFEELSTKIAVLGWVERADVALGTGCLPVDSIAVSDAANVSHIQVDSNIVRKVELQASLPAPFNLGQFTVGRSRQTEWTNSTLRFTVPDTFSRMLQKTSRAMVVYDVEGKIAWQVPTLSMVLHMAQYYMHKYGEDTWSEMSHVELPTARLDFDGGKAAAEAIQEARRSRADFVLHKETPDDGSANMKTLTLSSFIKDLYYRLLEATTHDPRETKKLAKNLSNCIWGYEFDDVANVLEPNCSRKEVKLQKTSGEWPLLLRNDKYQPQPVIFIKGLGSAIQPAKADPNREACHDCKQVPEGNDYLVTTVFSLRSLNEAAGKSVEKEMISGLRWHCPKTTKYPFLCCPDLKSSWSDLHLQCLSKAKKTDLPFEIEAQSTKAVVFGAPSKKGPKLHTGVLTDAGGQQLNHPFTAQNRKRKRNPDIAELGSELSNSSLEDSNMNTPIDTPANKFPCRGIDTSIRLGKQSEPPAIYEDESPFQTDERDTASFEQRNYPENEIRHQSTHTGSEKPILERCVWAASGISEDTTMFTEDP